MGSSDDPGSSRFGSPYSEQASPLPDFRDAARMQLRPLNVPVRLVPPAPKVAAREARTRRDGQVFCPAFSPPFEVNHRVIN